MQGVHKRDNIELMIPNSKGTSNAKKASGRSALPFFIEFVKFSVGFAAIIAVGLFTMHIASAAI